MSDLRKDIEARVLDAMGQGCEMFDWVAVAEVATERILAIVRDAVTDANAVDALLESLLVDKDVTPETYTVVVTEEMMYDALDAVADEAFGANAEQEVNE